MLLPVVPVDSRYSESNRTQTVPRLGLSLSSIGSTTFGAPYMADPIMERDRAFLKNHLPEIAAMDFVTVPTVSFKVLYCLFIIHHDRQRVLHTNVTANPTAAWVLQQLREVFFEGPGIKYIIHDRDTKFARVAEWLKSAGAESVLTGYRSPWQNGIAEKWVLTLRRELLDHVVVFNESHIVIVGGLESRSFVVSQHSWPTVQLACTAVTLPVVSYCGE